VRIAYVSSGYPPDLGGVERHVAELATRMAADGHAVEVLTQSRGAGLSQTELIDGVLVRRFPVRLSAPRLAVAPGLWARLGRHGVGRDIVHVHNYHSAASLVPALAGARPLVFTPHYLGTGPGSLLRLLHAAYRPFGRVLFRRSDRVICVSRAEAAMVRARFPSLAAPIEVVPNGVDVAGLRRAEAHVVEGEVILSAGRLEPYKNVELTLRALAHLSEEFRLCVAGDGPERERLEGLGRRLGLKERVVFLGRLPAAELYRWLRTASVYVTLSPRECFGITLLEAIVAGAGTVASDIAAHREVLERTPARAAALVPARVEPPALAEAIRGVARGIDCRRPARDPASWDAVAARHLRIYRSVATGG
jgi:glycosyltransferase involved in cell wall biosynthesis